MTYKFSHLKRLAFRFVLGKRDFEYAIKMLAWDKRLPGARLVDIVVRQDAVEKRFESDWLKRLAKYVLTERDKQAAEVARQAAKRFEQEEFGTANHQEHAE